MTWDPNTIDLRGDVAQEWMAESLEFRSLSRHKTIIGENKAVNVCNIWMVTYVKDGKHHETKGEHLDPWSAVLEAREDCMTLVPCKRCQGTGRVRTDFPEGQIQCYKCDGIGKVEILVCSECGGSRKVTDTDDQVWPCPKCKERDGLPPTTNCTECDGSGAINGDRCDHCNGKGFLTR